MPSFPAGFVGGQEGNSTPPVEERKRTKKKDREKQRERRLLLYPSLGDNADGGIRVGQVLSFPLASQFSKSFSRRETIGKMSYWNISETGKQGLVYSFIFSVTACAGSPSDVRGFNFQIIPVKLALVLNPTSFSISMMIIVINFI